MNDWKVHLYGKKEPKMKRKMGHVTILRDNVEDALDEIQKSSIWAAATVKIGG
jgi:5-(carboxyamino)imidazole ribonucleotide synthase